VAEAVGEDMERWCVAEHEEAVNRYEQELLAKEKTVPTLYIEMDGTGVPMVPHDMSSGGVEANSLTALPKPVR